MTFNPAAFHSACLTFATVCYVTRWKALKSTSTSCRK